MRLLQALRKPFLAMANGSCPRVARAIGEPERDVLAARLLADLNTFQNVIERGLADFRVGIAKRPILVNLVLENIGVDRAEANAAFVAEAITADVLLRPSGKSQRTCVATEGQQAVKRCTCPASLNFSSVVVAAESWMNFPKRVPVLANPQDGSSIANVFKAL